MGTWLSWRNTFHNRRRCLAATAGISFAILLVFMEVGFLDAARLNAALLYKGLNFDLAIVSRGYVSAERTLPVNPFRILQSRNVPGIASAVPLWIDGAHWMNRRNRSLRSCRVIGVEPGDRVFRDAQIDRRLSRIKSPDSALVDRLSSRKYGPWAAGSTVIIGDVPLTVAGTFAMGTGLISDGGVIVSRETFDRITGRDDNNGFDVGLLRVKKGYDPAALVRAVKAALPADVLVLSRNALIRREQFYWVNVKPVGIMFRVGALVAFLIGAVILYQVLSLEIGNRLNEFATMKALGYPQRRIYRVGVEQALIFSMLGYIPAFLLATGLYRIIFDLSRLPLFMQPGRALLVLAMTLVMCAIAAFLALRKLRRADPAALFS
jgi:putative ABC transport system permease protein